MEEAQALADSVNLRWRNDLLRALILLELGVGVVERSPVERLSRALGDPPLLRDTPANATAPELVEALVRAGDAEAATELLAPFADEAERVGQAFPRPSPSDAEVCSRPTARTTASSSVRSSSTPSTRTCSRRRARGWHTASAYGGAADESTRATS